MTLGESIFPGDAGTEHKRALRAWCYSSCMHRYRATCPESSFSHFNLESAVERGAIAQLIGSPALAQKPQLTHRVSPRFCANAFNPSRQRRRCSQVHIHAQLPNPGSLEGPAGSALSDIAAGRSSVNVEPLPTTVSTLMVPS